MTGPTPALVEPVWENLRSQLALQPGFWLGFLFCSDLNVLDELQTRARNYSRIHLKNTQARQVDRPEDLMATMSWLLGEHPQDLAATWLIGVTGEPEPWRDAWATFLRRLNERRDLLRTVLPAGVLLVCPTNLLVTAREEAPDLWSYRAMVEVVDSAPIVAEPATTIRSPGSAGDDEDLRWAVEHVLEPGVDPGPELRPILHRTTAALQADHPADAVAAGREALEAARRPADRTLAHAWLALALASRDDLPAALGHTRHALAGHQPLGRDITRALLALLAQTPDLDERLVVRKAQVDISRVGLEQVGEAPETLSDLSVCLDNLGYVYETRGQRDQANEMYTAALEVDRHRIDAYGETPNTLRSLSVSLDRVGDIHLQRGQLDQALTHYTESLELRRRIHDHHDETPDTLRELATSLDNLGRVYEAQGQLDQANEAYTAALEVDRHTIDTYGETPETIHDLAMSLGNVGDIQRQRGQLDQALTHHTEALKLTRRAHDHYDETPETLRDLAISLVNVGDIHRQRGQLDQALTDHTESLELARRIHDHYGETPQALRDLSASLANVARVKETQGAFDEALTAYLEALDVYQRLGKNYGPPFADEAEWQRRVASVERVRDRLE